MCKIAEIGILGEHYKLQQLLKVGKICQIWSFPTNLIYKKYRENYQNLES